jgi:hypothetical protein
MELIKTFIVATTGGVFLQSIQPVPLGIPGEAPSDMLIRMLISVAGGILSTLAFRFLERKLWARRKGRNQKPVKLNLKN